jgi:divinyl chlorophyllide a 8-vinyl-reductase
VSALLNQGHEVVCFVRQPSSGVWLPEQTAKFFEGASLRYGDVSNPVSLKDQGFKGEHFDVLVSCLASRTGNPKDAWAIDHQAHMRALDAAKRAGVSHFVLLSAICVQKPLLAFQHAKLAFETALIESGMTYSIVRPTAFFKSLSGQLDRVKKGKPFLLFGDGALTACKPISDSDLGDYIAGCIHDQTRHNRILPIGGPGAAITPREQGEKLFELLGQEARFKQIPVAMMDVIIAVLSFLGRVIPSLADKAELARIGRYYATESMLVWDRQSESYDAAATPSTGTQTLFDFYADLVQGGEAPERGDHAVF